MDKDKPVLKLVELENSWFGRVEPKLVLEGVAKDVEEIQEVLVLTYTKDGRLMSASSLAEIGELFLMVERFKHAVLNGAYETD
jgi:hypothetical protein